MKTESDIRQMIDILRAFNRPNKRGTGIHDLEIVALLWAIGEYPPSPVEQLDAPPRTEPGFQVRTAPGGFAVRSVANPSKKEEA